MPIPFLMIGLLIAKGMTFFEPTKECLEELNLDPHFQDEDAFPTILGNIEKYTSARFQQHIDDSVILLLQMHTMLVLLQAATRDFKPSQSESPAPRYNYKPHPTILVSAFSDDEEKEIKAIQKAIENVTNAMDGKFIARPYSEIAGCLKEFLDIAKDLPPGFNISQCLATCQDTIDNLNTPRKKTCMRDMLALGRLVFSEVDMAKVIAIAQDPTRQQAQSPDAWLDQQLSTTGLWDNDVKTYYRDNLLSEEKQLTLGYISKMLGGSHNIYETIIYKDPNDPALDNNRLGDSFKQAIASFPGEWENLRLALHGAVAWHIYRLCAYAAAEVKAVLREK